MTELSPDERRRRYFDEYRDRIGQHGEGETFYEQRAIEFAHNGLKALTYLNGGGLLAIPTVVALFRADPKDVKLLLICAAGAFVGGLLFVVAAQVCAFFVMANRSEAAVQFKYEEVELLAAVHYPAAADVQTGRTTRAQTNRTVALSKINRSNIWRAASLCFVGIALFLFIAGCLFGAEAVFPSK
jgi:hypothetical protein